MLAKEYSFRAFDVDITINPDGTFLVRERQVFSFTGGPFTYAFAEIPMDRVVDITDIAVEEGGRPYTMGRRQGVPGTFTVGREGNKLVVTWWYPPTADSERSFMLSYLVHGGLRYYEGGDQLWWKAVSPDITVPVMSSRVVVHLSTVVSEADLKAASYGAPARISRPDGATVVFEATDIGPQQGMEIRVQFPHGLVAGSPAPWQVEADREAALEPYIAMANLVLLFVGVLIALGSLGGVFLLWFTHGRDRPAVMNVAILKEPPDDMPPGLVGALMDERLDIRDVVATLLDLARRKALSIEERGKDWVFHSGDLSQAGHRYEKLLLMQLFGSSDVTTLGSQRERFYAVLPVLAQEVFKELTSLGMFAEDPRSVRARFTGFGILALVAAFILGLWVSPALGLWGIIALAVGLGVLGLALLGVAPFMPQKTTKGAAAVQRWKAFRNYLADVGRYTDLKQARGIFEKYLPYAVAFGLTRRWVESFAAVGAPAPDWYFGRGVRYRTTGYRPAGESSGGPAVGFPDLQPASDNLASGLQSLSDNLMDLIDTASQVFDTRPASSRSGGGWSGGGVGGGGGGGGGGRGAG